MSRTVQDWNIVLKIWHIYWAVYIYITTGRHVLTRPRLRRKAIMTHACWCMLFVDVHMSLHFWPYKSWSCSSSYVRKNKLWDEASEGVGTWWNSSKSSQIPEACDAWPAQPPRDLRPSLRTPLCGPEMEEPRSSGLYVFIYLVVPK